MLLPGLLPLRLRPEQPVGLGRFANIWRRDKKSLLLAQWSLLIHLILLMTGAFLALIYLLITQDRFADVSMTCAAALAQRLQITNVPIWKLWF